MIIPFLDLKQQYDSIAEEVKLELEELFNMMSFISGPQVSEFERAFANYCETEYCTSVNSGTDAIRIALLSCGIEPGDEVITTPNTFIATTEAISQIGAKIVFVDIDEKTYNIDAKKIEASLSSKTKAILPVHLYGQCADMDEINSIASRYNLLVIEDASQAHGALYKNKKAGSLADIAAFSFYPSKNLGAYGDGGALVTNTKEYYNKAILLRNHGQIEKNYHEMEGFNSRLDSIQACVLNIKLKYLDKWNNERRNKAKYYNELFMNSDVITPYEPEWSQAVYHLYSIRVKKRQELQAFLSSNGIGTGIHYPLPLHLQKAYNYLGYKKGSFPVAEKVASEIISLPLYPELNEKQMEFIFENVIKGIRNN